MEMGEKKVSVALQAAIPRHMFHLAAPFNTQRYLTQKMRPKHVLLLFRDSPPFIFPTREYRSSH